MSGEQLEQSAPRPTIKIEYPHKSTINATVRVVRAEDKLNTAIAQAGGEIDSNPKVIKARLAKEVAEQARRLTPEYKIQIEADEAAEAAKARGDTAEEQRLKAIAWSALWSQFNARILANRIIYLQRSAEKMKGTGFIVGGRNETSVIRNLVQMNGIPIAELEINMRDGLTAEEQAEDFKEQAEDFGESQLYISPEDASSLTEGQKQSLWDTYNEIYLGPDDSLINTLAGDNDTVLGLGLTHQQLADCLDFFKDQEVGRHRFNGIDFDLNKVGFRISAWSPFKDGSGGSMDFYLTRSDTKEVLFYGSLLPQMIRMWGFYEGKGTYFRVDPRKLAEFVGLVPKQ